MFLRRLACAGLLVLAACASSSKSVSASREARVPMSVRPGVPSYGFHPEDPVRVGWGNQGILAFFELLRGPEGQRVAWRRVGPCCGAQPTSEVFEVTYEGLSTPVRMYLDPHHGGALRAPQGFTMEGLTSHAPREPQQKPEVIEL